MKVTNWRRKLAATLLAGGLMSPAEVYAANLDTNLVVNPGFETVDISTVGDYNAVKVLNWAGGVTNGFAYSHTGSLNGPGNVVPDYAIGDVDPPSAGNWYFSSNNNPAAASGDYRNPGEFFQDIDVSAGPSGAQIASGEAAVNISAYMSSYLTNNDFGNVHVEFRGAGGASLGSTVVTNAPGPVDQWAQHSGGGVIPKGTNTLRVSLFGTPTSGGADGYMDNIDVKVTNAANDFLYLHVNTANGQVAIKNQTGDPVHLDYYIITSADSALNKTGWSSLQDQNRTGFPSGNGTGNGWEEGGVTNAKVLSETYLSGNSLVGNGASIGLGPAFNIGGAQNLVFKYSVVPELSLPLAADFDNDLDADGADFLAWQRGFGILDGATKSQGDADGDFDVDADDLSIWETEFGGPGGPGNLVTGFIHYDATGPATGVPEPNSVIIAALLLAPLAARRRTGSA